MRNVTRVRGVSRGVLISICLLFASHVMAELPTYRVQDLGTLGGRITHASDLNESGQVTGYSETADGQLRAFLYRDGQMQALGTLGGAGSLGNALNDAGQVTGFSVTTSGSTRAFIYVAGSMTDLGPPGSDSIGNDISNLGRVAGYSIRADGSTRAFRHAAGIAGDLGATADLGSFATAINEADEVAGTYHDATGSHAFLHGPRGRRDLVPGRVSSIFGTHSLNDAGQVTGSFEVRGVTRAFLFENGRANDIGGLGGNYSYGYGLNAAGDVTGVSDTATGLRHAFIYSAGSVRDLGTLGGPVSFGYAINRSKQVAGEATVAAGGYHAFVYSRGRMLDLGVAVEQLTRSGFIESVAYDINDAGQVIGRYYLPDAADPSQVRFRGFIATPIALLIESLLAQVNGVGPGKSLANKVNLLRRFYLAQDKASTCASLKVLNRELMALEGKKLPRASSRALQKNVSGIAAAIACP